MFIFGKIKTLVIAALAIAVPIIYLMGKVKGSSAEKKKILEDELEASNKSKEFYKKMSEHENDNLADRSDVSKRLRKSGL
jgi:Na+-transporting methylmalonyl-CoA/oxaloacetate decarboxylase gamma subunit